MCTYIYVYTYIYIYIILSLSLYSYIYIYIFNPTGSRCRSRGGPAACSPTACRPGAGLRRRTVGL